MITRTGTVTITGEGITATDFTVDGGGALEILEWAMMELRKAKESYEPPMIVAIIDYAKEAA